MLRGSLARQFHFAAQTETVGPSHLRISNSATCGSFLLRRKSNDRSGMDQLERQTSVTQLSE
jgi:hypothetical protein